MPETEHNVVLGRWFIPNYEHQFNLLKVARLLGEKGSIEISKLLGFPPIRSPGAIWLEIKASAVSHYPFHGWCSVPDA